jgi:hypothetical protein
VEAQGFTRAIVPYRSSPGGIVDAGSVVLKRATTENTAPLTVILKDVADIDAYTIQLLSGGGRAIRPPVSFSKDGTARIEFIDPRPHGFEVRKNTPEAGRKVVWHGQLAFSPQRLTAEIELAPDTPKKVPTQP